MQNILSEVFNDIDCEEVDKITLYDKIDYYLDERIIKFKTLAPNRTTLSQAINYTKYQIYINENVPIEYKFIENYIKEQSKEKYIFKYQHQYKDGYIQKR